MAAVQKLNAFQLMVVEFFIDLSLLDLLICLDTVQKYANLGLTSLLLVIKPSLFLRLVILVVLLLLLYIIKYFSIICHFLYDFTDDLKCSSKL